MEKTKKNVKGKLMVSEAVISTIAVNAVKDIDEVVKILPQPKTIKNIMLSSGSASPVKVGYVDDVVELSVYISIKKGTKATKVAKLVQEKVKSNVQAMTGLTVARVNVTVADVVVTA